MNLAHSRPVFPRFLYALATASILLGAVIGTGQAMPVKETAPEAPSLTLLNRQYHLGSYNQKSHPMWEYVSAGETVEQWSTLVTLIERKDATTVAQVDQLSEGIMTTYKQGGAQILSAKTLRDTAGKPFNYLVVAFNEPARKRFEFNFVKIALGPKHAFTAIYGVRISDPQDYLAKAKQFLTEHSAEVGQAVGEATWPDLGALPRREF